MSLSHAYGVPPDRETAQGVLRAAVELGITHFDTAALYGFGLNEELVGATLEPFRERIVLTSKCGMTGVDGKRVIDGRPETLKRTCHESLERLKTDYIDLYYLHRWDKKVPIEDSVGALADLVAAGDVRAIGLSEVSAPTLRKAHAVHPITAVQSEYSLWTRNPEVALLDACRELRDRARRVLASRSRISGRWDTRSFDAEPTRTYAAACRAFSRRISSATLPCSTVLRGLSAGGGVHKGATRARMASVQGVFRTSDLRYDLGRAPQGEHRRAVCAVSA